MVYHFEVVVDHFQIMIADSVRGVDEDTTQLWDSTDGRVAQLPSRLFIAVGTVRYGGVVRVTVEVAGGPRTLPEEWEVLGEFSLEVPSGRVVLFGPEEAGDLHLAPTVPLEPALYSGCAFCKGADSVKDEMDLEGPDEYRIVLWKQ
jgi:hypothetical protein